MSRCFPRDVAWQSTYVHVNTNGIQHLGLSDLPKCSPVVLPSPSSKLVTLEIAVEIRDLQITAGIISSFIYHRVTTHSVTHYLLIDPCMWYLRGLPRRALIHRSFPVLSWAKVVFAGLQWLFVVDSLSTRLLAPGQHVTPFPFGSYHPIWFFNKQPLFCSRRNSGDRGGWQGHDPGVQAWFWWASSLAP